MKVSSVLGSVGLALAAVLCGSVVAQEPIPLGGEFQVNNLTGGDQGGVDVSAAADGRFVVSFSSVITPSVRVRLYDQDGVPVGGEFPLNETTPGGQFSAAIAMAPGGDFVATWVSSDPPGPEFDLGIRAQRFAADGTPLGDDFQVSTYTPNYQNLPAIAVAPGGEFVVSWASFGSSGTDTSNYSIQGQRYDAGGSPAGGEFQVNTYTTSIQFSPAVATAPDGDFIVVWESDGSNGTDTSGVSFQGQRYDAGGASLGAEFQVNTYTPDTPPAYVAADAMAVDTDADGSFVVVWNSPGSAGTDTAGFSIQGQRYDTDGDTVGGQFQVNTFTTGYQGNPDVAMGPVGEFVVVWTGASSDDTFFSIEGQLFGPDGSAVGDQFRVNTYTTEQQRFPAVAFDSPGHIIVVWTSSGSGGNDNSGSSVQGQRYASPFIFLDGFESGDTSSWD